MAKFVRDGLPKSSENPGPRRQRVVEASSAAGAPCDSRAVGRGSAPRKGGVFALAGTARGGKPAVTAGARAHRAFDAVAEQLQAVMGSVESCVVGQHAPLATAGRPPFPRARLVAEVAQGFVVVEVDQSCSVQGPCDSAECGIVAEPVRSRKLAYRFLVASQARCPRPPGVRRGIAACPVLDPHPTFLHPRSKRCRAPSALPKVGDQCRRVRNSHVASWGPPNLAQCADRCQDRGSEPAPGGKEGMEDLGQFCSDVPVQCNELGRVRHSGDHVRVPVASLDAGRGQGVRYGGSPRSDF